MTARDLYAELEMTQRPLGTASFTRFRELGIPNGVIFGDQPLVGVAHIVPHSSGFFDFHDEGEPAIIVPEGEPVVLGWGEIDDLIAFKPADPANWWLRRGNVDLLGCYNITPWRLDSLCICVTPLSWLQAGAKGVCILDWGLNPASVLLGAGYLEVESLALKTRLERRISVAALAPFHIKVAEATATPEARHAA